MHFWRFYLFISVAITSCGHIGNAIEKVSFSEDEQAWLGPYRVNQVLIFKSSLGNFDTLVVTKKDKFYAGIDTLSEDSIQFERYFLEMQRKGGSDNSEASIELVFEKKEKNKDCNKCFYVFDIFWCGTTIGADVIIYENSQNAGTLSGGKYASFVWSKYDGLIEYTTNQGEVFSIQN